MIFQFPDLESLRLAITSAQVPVEVCAAPAEFSLHETGTIAVKMTGGMPPKPMQNALKKLGVKPAKDHFTTEVQQVTCWPQLLPVVKLPHTPEVTTNTAILFDLPANEMPSVVMEMLRLGNDRQSFRVLAPNTKRGERVLLKVIGPPYYTLLRAIDRSSHSAINAYIEKAPGVWVELGYEHPLASQIRPPKGEIRLLRPVREWIAIEDGPFQDVYEVLDFKLPTGTVEWQEAQLKGKLAVPLRLVAGNAADVAEMWVLQDDAIDQLDALVRDADERLMSRLSFAVATDNNGPTTIVLKVRPSKLSPPVLSLDKAMGFKPYWKLPNLFLPIGTRMMPTLRRDAIRKLLADDPAEIVWLMPEKEGKFTPESLPDDAFRPLEDWIDYIIDHEHQVLQSWVQATQFDFESFVCKDDQQEKPKTPPTDKGRKDRKDEDNTSPDDRGQVPTKQPKKKTPTKSDDQEFALPVESGPPDELKQQRTELEKEFLEHAGPLDDPARIHMWRRLAEISASLNDQSESAICWMNSFWEEVDVPVAGAWGWLRTEDRAARREVTGADFDGPLQTVSASPNEVRQMVARIVYACLQDPIPPVVLSRLPALRQYVERNEDKLGVRAIWLAWTHLVRAGGPADILGLARVRDRLLQRLLKEGLNKERDLPYFLRMAGAQDSDRMRIVRDRAAKVHRLVEKWHSGDDLKVNKPYVDLMFAFAMAKLGENTAARDLMNLAHTEIFTKSNKDKVDPAHQFMFEAFTWRIENVLQGKAHNGPLSPELLAKLDTLDEGRGTSASKRYVVDRLREQSWILEPQDKNDPYAPWKKHGSDIQAAVADLAKIQDPNQLEERIKKLLKAHPTADSNRLLIFSTAVNLAPRCNEDWALQLVQQVPSLLDALAKLKTTRDDMAKLANEQTKLLERSLFAAGHFDRRELVQSLFNRFLQFVQDSDDEIRVKTINDIARECLRSLRKVGLKDEINHFLKHITEVVTQNKSLIALRQSSGSKWPDVLTAMLYLAEAWQYSGAYAQAKPFLEEARTTIYNNAKDKTVKVGLSFTGLVRTYVSALGQGPVDEALNRIEELFQKLEKLPNSFTTNTHFSRLHLNIVEDVVRSLISENFTMGDVARRWLDDDEYLVRRRIHSDMRYLLKQHGL